MRSFYSIAFIVNPMIRHETWAWCVVILRGTSRQEECVPETKKVLLMLHYIDKNWYHFIWNNFQSLLFKKLLALSGDQTDIFLKFYSPADTLLSPKTVGRVLGYTMGSSKFETLRRKNLVFRTLSRLFNISQHPEVHFKIVANGFWNICIIHSIHARYEHFITP